MWSGEKWGLGRRRAWGVIVGCLWLGGIATGMALLARHEGAPGIAATAPRQWPQESQIPLSDGIATLVMFAHPHCPCTRASLGELEKIVARQPGKVAPWIVVYQPIGGDEAGDDSDQWAAAAQVPGAHVLLDRGGAEARRFRAATSGQTLLYDRTGALQFSGGITLSRGHAGDNPGRSAIELLLSGATPATRTAPVFGCSLLDSPGQN